MATADNGSAEDRAKSSDGWGKITYASGSVYEGDLKDGKRHGRGKMTFTSGSVYDGDWVNGRMHGQGKHTWANGNVYEGDLVDGKRHGQGKLEFANGNVYEGDWVNDKRHGQGKYEFPDGVDVGDWVDDKKHGQGKLTFEDGRIYEGTWVDGKRDGEFKARMKGGASYRQVYRNAKRVLNEQAGDWTATLGDEHTMCQICSDEFSSDLNAIDENVRRRLPVLGSCGHCYCHGCILELHTNCPQLKSDGVPTKIQCVTCKKVGAFCPSEPIYFRLLVDLLERKTFNESE